MKRALLLLSAALLFAAPSRFTRVTLTIAEKGVDEAFAQVSLNEPMLSLQPTQGVYIEGFGLVLQQEVNIKPVAAPSPFKPSYTKPEIEKIRATKLEKLPMLRATMKDILYRSAKLPELPNNENVVLSVKLFHWTFEDKTGLPSQVVMQAQKRSLMTVPKAQIDPLIQVREY